MLTEDRDMIGTQSARNGNYIFFQIITIASRSSRHHPDTVPTTHDSVTILIRHSRICYDIVTIVIRLDKVGWVSRMVRDAHHSREWFADLPDLPDSVTNVHDCVPTMIGHSRSVPTVIRLFHFSCRSAVGTQSGAIIGNVWTRHNRPKTYKLYAPHTLYICRGIIVIYTYTCSFNDLP